MSTESLARFDAVRTEIQKVIIGQQALVEQALIGLLAGGHIILEGVPGLAKTLFAKALAASLSLDFKRAQFTPDLMPSDLLGTNVFQPDKGQFSFYPGPVFTDVLLADEINRTPPKTQSALLEAMEERQVSIDGEDRKLSDHFFVIATQNPIEYEGTFPLPEAQVDRFLLKIRIGYPTPADELTLLKKNGGQLRNIGDRVKAVAGAEDLAAARAFVAETKVEDSLYDYLLRLVQTTRSTPQISLGASPRAAQGWLASARALARLRERDFVTPDDIKELAPAVLRHRLVLTPEAEIEGTSVEQVIEQVLAAVEVPR